MLHVLPYSWHPIPFPRWKIKAILSTLARDIHPQFHANPACLQLSHPKRNGETQSGRYVTKAEDFVVAAGTAKDVQGNFCRGMYIMRRKLPSEMGTYHSYLILSAHIQTPPLPRHPLQKAPIPLPGRRSIPCETNIHAGLSELLGAKERGQKSLATYIHIIRIRWREWQGSEVGAVCGLGYRHLVLEDNEGNFGMISGILVAIICRTNPISRRPSTLKEKWGMYWEYG